MGLSMPVGRIVVVKCLIIYHNTRYERSIQQL
jgi:hypothetical protein